MRPVYVATNTVKIPYTSSSNLSKPTFVERYATLMVYVHAIVHQRALRTCRLRLNIRYISMSSICSLMEMIFLLALIHRTAIAILLYLVDTQTCKKSTMWLAFYIKIVQLNILSVIYKDGNLARVTASQKCYLLPSVMGGRQPSVRLHSTPI